MSLADAVRERATRCVYCDRPVWTIQPVCRARRCQTREANYRLRRSASAAERAGHPLAGGPAIPPHAFDETACAGGGGAAISARPGGAPYALPVPGRAGSDR